MNLVKNAADAINSRGTGGTIIIATERRGSDLLLHIEDSDWYRPEALKKCLMFVTSGWWYGLDYDCSGLWRSMTVISRLRRN